MRRRLGLAFGLALGFWLLSSGVARGAVTSAAPPAKLTIVPPAIKLSGRGATQRFLVIGHYADGRSRDLTAVAKLAKTGGIHVEGHRIVTVANGPATVTAVVGAARATMQVTVADVDQEPQWSFANEIVPIFTKAGCNSGGCHGSPSGRGQFKLSLFGFEPDYDYDMVTKDHRGRRINKELASESLILKKPTMAVPHGGGMRFKPGSEFYNRIKEWITAGAPKQPEFDPRLARIEIFPSEWTLEHPKETQPLLVVAVRDDDTTQDVTQYARFTSSDDGVVDVNDDGRMEATGKGETSIMVRYLGGVGVVRVRVPRDPLPAAAFANFQPVNYVDQIVLEKLKEVRVPPSGPASDAEFLRRACIDTCGITPTIEETRAFLADKDPEKRIRLISSLLDRPEFVDYWTLKWSDLLRNTSLAKQDKGLQVFYRWIRDSIRQNKPYDQFARELITASGSGYRNGPVNWYNTGDFGDDYPLLIASATSQVFLGVRIDCARCHNHPFEAWSQMDYYGLAAFFARTKKKDGPEENERIFYAASEGELKHPRKPDVVIPAKFLDGAVAQFSGDEDRREKLAEWITNPNRNPWFARSIANRLWNNFFGRGIVQPVDDYRVTNPASNPKLLDALAAKVVEYRFDLKKVMRDILVSRTYQATSAPNKQNVGDVQYASHALPRRLFAEVLLDALSYATGIQDKLGPYEYGRRAISVPDNRVPSEFLDLFGRARREVACECERDDNTNVTMVLDLLNGGEVNGKITSPNGRVARAVAANKPPKEIIEEFYLATLCRPPTEKEQAAAMKLLSGAPSPREGAEDLMWGLLNTREFMFNH